MARNANNTQTDGNIPPAPPDISQYLNPALQVGNVPQIVPAGSGAPSGSGGVSGTRTSGNQTFADSGAANAAIAGRPARNA